MGKLSEINQSAWRARRVVKSYSTETQLQPSEQRIIDELKLSHLGGRILDLGVGCGRTTQYLLEVSNNYIGIDYSPEMVACAKEKYPDVDFRVGDARDLSSLGESQFDVVFFSFNGLDCTASHADRMKILQEIYKVLAPAGVFAFSSHRLGAHVRSPYSLGRIPLTWNPVRLLKAGRKYTLSLARHWRLRKREFRGPNYAILNDSGGGFAFLTYYVRPEYQTTVLRDLGFRNVRVLDMDGTSFNTDGSGLEKDNPWLHYMATK